MKFVKGDVIASLVILVVNILGGLTIGVVMKGMPVDAALRRYGLLTIGDGLVTQIPALVLSTAAGVLVTRVASEDADTPLGAELARQLFAVPKALHVASGFVVALAPRSGPAPGPVPRPGRRPLARWPSTRTGNERRKAPGSHRIPPPGTERELDPTSRRSCRCSSRGASK